MPRHDDDDYDFDRPRGVGRPRSRRRKRGPGLPKPGPLVIALGIAALIVLLSFVIPGSGEALAVIGIAVAVVGNLWFYGVALSDGVGQLLLCLFIPFYALFYLIMNFENTKYPFGLSALGGLIFVGCLIGAAAREGSGRGAPAEVAEGREEPRPAPRVEPPRAGPRPVEPPKAADPKNADPTDPTNPNRPFAVDPQAKAAGKTVYLAALTPFAYQAGPWPYKVGVTGALNEHAIKVQGKEYKYGLSAHPPLDTTKVWRVSFAPGGEFKRFKGWGAVNDNTNPRGKVGFAVWGDGRKLWEPAPLDKGGAAVGFDIDITGVQVLTLETGIREGSHFGAHAVWLDPWLER